MKKILVIDDDADILDLLRLILGPAGYSVSTAASGEEGIELIGKESFDLVFSDLRMPGMDGIKLLKQIRSASPQTEVIIITGQTTVESAVEALKNGAFSYILKPFNNDEIVLSAQKCLEFSEIKLREKIFRETVQLYQAVQERKCAGEERDILRNILERITGALGADAGSVYVIVHGREKLVPAATIGDFVQEKETELVIGKRVAGWVAEKRKTVLINDELSVNSEFGPVDKRPEIISSLVTPMLSHGALVGVICLNRYKYQTNYYFTQKDMESLEILVRHATLIFTGVRDQNASR